MREFDSDSKLYEIICFFSWIDATIWGFSKYFDDDSIRYLSLYFINLSDLNFDEFWILTIITLLVTILIIITFFYMKRGELLNLFNIINLTIYQYIYILLI